MKNIKVIIEEGKEFCKECGCPIEECCCEDSIYIAATTVDKSIDGFIIVSIYDI